MRSVTPAATTTATGIIGATFGDDAPSPSRDYDCRHGDLCQGHAVAVSVVAVSTVVLLLLLLVLMIREQRKFSPSAQHNDRSHNSGNGDAHHDDTTRHASCGSVAGGGFRAR